MNQNIKDKKNKIIILGIMITCILGMYIYLTYIKNDLDSHAVMATNDNKSQEEIKKELSNKEDKDLIIASMNISPTFKTGDSEGDLNIEVSPKNYYPIRVEITLNKDNSLIYKSGKIDPGYMIKDVKIDKKLEKGSYECTATFITLDQHDEEIKRASAQIHITVEQ